MTQSPAPSPQAEETQALARSAFLRKRHFALLLSFLLWVVLPTFGSGVYLYTVAKDQYASYVGFAVRKEETSSAIEVLGGITDLAGTSSSDTDILFKFIKGREMIRAIDAKLDLETLYRNPADPVFGLSEGASQEALERYWNRVVKIFYDRNSGLIELRVTAFQPQAAQDVANAIVEESTRMLNALTTIAREDTTRYAREELDHSLVRLKEARQAITQFRAKTQIIDPLADTEGRMSLLNSLQTQLAAALIELDLLRQSAQSGDPRILQEERRVEVIQARIAEERQRFGSEVGTGDDTYSKLVGEYEALAVDQEFAEKSYLNALATYDAALAEAQRQSRYLATYIPPTLAEEAEYPQRFTLLLLIASGALFSWAIAALIYYSVRDRR
ncbi:sugar transporter [Cognatishimia maritima]|uniref:Capsular polysaccharide transport system permease protein n=1 Tax=Cognatishimia maritima TaxID=870908 RepID=A0A1M5WCQ2_9RHOB|nr:sugar transporter [Cognatishimia maritima]SHH85230.1 capsular polysaccharide transport system permease protein [Cognatishimia maritima]